MLRRRFCHKRGMNAKVPSVRNQPDPYSGLTDREIDQLFHSLNNFSKIALAVSGGGDSVCLLIAFCEWRSRRNWEGACEVVVVDHQLRPESSQETCFVRELSEQHGLHCHILKWTDDKPETGVQEAARDARYQLIAKQTAVSGYEAVLLAHHLDDQAETFLDRLTRGSGLNGLGAMASYELEGPAGLRLLRPFLGVPKSRLLATLEDRGQKWCEDPSNKSLKYKRSRLRSISSTLAEEGLSPSRISTTARQLRRAREALETVLAELFRQHVEDHPAGPAKTSALMLRAQSEEFRLRLLILMIERVTGRVYQPKLRKIEALDHWILNNKAGRQTLGGAVLEMKRDTLFVWKEIGRSPPVVLENLCGEGKWDARFLFDVQATEGAPPNGMTVSLGPLFNAPVDRRQISWPNGWPKEAFESAPVFWIGNGPVGVRSAASLIWHDARRGGYEISLQRIPVPAKLAGNYRTDLEGS
jgi:tRNA(Ile)-lysidine synthase